MRGNQVVYDLIDNTFKLIGIKPFDQRIEKYLNSSVGSPTKQLT